MNLYKEPDIAKKITALVKKTRTIQSDWRTEAKEDFNFPAGHQWDEPDEDKLKTQGRPMVTFNRCNAILSAILGMEANQRQQATFTPRDNSDSAITEAVDQIANWARDYSEVEIEEAQSFEDMLTCGMGWTETRMDFDTDMDGKIIQETVPPLEMTWDDSARKRNLTDARWVNRGKKMSVEEIKDQWPDAELDISEDILKDDDDSKTQVIDPEHRYEGDGIGDKGTRKPQVLQFQWFEKTPVYRIATPGSGEIYTKPVDEFKKMKPLLDAQGAKYVKQYTRKYYQAFVIGGVTLEKSEAPCQTGFSLKCMTGKHDHIYNQWYGIVRLMKDPQRWANKFFSTFIDIIDSNAKGGLLVEEGAVANIRKFEEDWAKADSVVWFRPGALAGNRIQPKPAAQYPQAVDKLLQFAIQSIYDVTGVNMEMLGLADRAQAGILEETRKKSAYTILAPFFDSLRSYRKQSGITLLEYIKNYLPEQRIAEVLEPALRQYAPMIKKIELNQMNVMVSETPQSDNHKAIVWAFISNILPSLMKMGIPIPPDILEYTPLPTPLVESWKKILPKPQEGPQMDPEMMAQVQQMQQALQELQQENQKLKSGEQAKLAELSLKKDISAAEIALKREEIQAEFALKQQELQSKMEQFLLELKTKMEMEMQEMAAELSAKKEMHSIEMGKDMMMQSHQAEMQGQQEESRETKKDESSKQNMEAMKEMMKMFAETMKTVGGAKKIVRDKSGKAMGVEPA